MPSPPAVRIVLQTGASAGFNRIFAVAFTFAAVLGGGMMALMGWADSLPAPHRYVLPFTPLAFLGASIGFHVATWRTRATDLLVGPDGLTVLGGPSSGASVPFAAIDPDRTGIREVPSMRATINGETTIGQRMVLGLRDGSEVSLGISIDRDEQLSFAGLATTILEAIAPPAALPAEGPATVVRCPGCGAPAQPADAATVGCWRCERTVAIDAPIRERVRAAAAFDGARAELLRKLEQVLRQPTAGVANAWMLATLVAPYVVPICVCASSGTWAAWIAVGMLIVEGSNLQVARRAAFHRLAVVFAARPAAAPGAPLRCRSCAGPLPASDTVLVGCPYCEADNVRALQLERPAALWASAALDLDVFLAAQRARVRGPILRGTLWALVATGSVVLFLAGGG